ncbi:hypothetical protein MSAN_00869200 [Mycena sanguinolenta]|uniref:Apple domain-containing protein n=1 Tax=Mycena sanguinolenta TaxID=230812 RepID=A0A8H7DA96_9AGAR|nr:hypothetical protein MSAN_00869200 [Mycena sanguinolenta]
MRFTTVFSTLVAAATSVAATAEFSSASVALAGGFTEKNCYGAPIPPWKTGHHPGWYYGSGTAPQGISCVLDSFFCELLNLFPSGYHCPSPPPHTPPHSPPPPPPYNQVKNFYNLPCAAQDDSYLTYGLVDTVDDCYAMCNSVSGCTFFNSAISRCLRKGAQTLSPPYKTLHLSVNPLQNGSPQLTCALFSKCLTAACADNCGGQSQSDGSIDYITESSGYCKAGY